MRKSNSVIIGLIVAASLAWGGYELRHSMVCSNLEEDYLNIASSVVTTTQANLFLAQAGKPSAAGEEMLQIHRREFEAKLTEIFERCGDRAARTAIRKSTQIP